MSDTRGWQMAEQEHAARLAAVKASYDAEIKRLREALEKWKCGLCDGTGRVGAWRYNEKADVGEVKCRTCDGDGLSAIARRALTSPPAMGARDQGTVEACPDCVYRLGSRACRGHSRALVLEEAAKVVDQGRADGDCSCVKCAPLAAASSRIRALADQPAGGLSAEEPNICVVEGCDPATCPASPTKGGTP